MPRPAFREERCKACGLCVSVCPKKILELSDRFNAKGYNIVRCNNESACIGCCFCAKTCPDQVIEIYK